MTTPLDPTVSNVPVIESKQWSPLDLIVAAWDRFKQDWLALLGFELNGGRFGCYAPPFAQARWLERCAFMEKAGDRWWPIAGGVYVVRGIKRQEGVRLVTPAWREPKAKRPALVQVARRDNVIHVRPIQRR